MGDMIERSKAIGALKDMYQAAEKWGREADDDVIKARAESCMASLVEMKLRIKNLPPAQPDNKINLCDSCKHTFPACPDRSTDVIWGNGTWNDNICVCSKYEPSAQPDITDVQAIEHLQATGWMQNHDHEMYMMGIRDGLADDSDSYDSLIQPEQKVGKWIRHENEGGEPYGHNCSVCGEWYVMPYGKTKFCPNCGAKMEEQNE